jgi:glycine/D-amino acid oxidase-like deaminating enzyme
MVFSMLDTLIVGGGLSGSLLAWRLLKAGRRALLLDAPPLDGRPPAYAVAAGLAAPVSGQRATLLPDAPATLALAQQTYEALGADLGRAFWRPLPILRCFPTPEGAQRWRERCADSAFQAYLREVDPSQMPESAKLKPLDSAFEIQGGGHLDLGALVPALQAWLESQGALRRERFVPGDFSAGTDGVQWRGQRAHLAAFCEGVAARGNPLFETLPFQPTRGELLELTIPGLDAERVLYGRHFLIPLGQDRYLCGATYDRQDLESGPSEAGRATLEEGLQELLKLPYRVTGQRCGVRPNVLGHAALWQRHPSQARLWRLNGLGSKGAWSAPRLTLQAQREIEEALVIE